MSDSGRTWNLLATVLVALALGAYFFLFPEPLGAELTPLARWSDALAPVARAQDAPVDALLPFSAGHRYGYFTKDGSWAFLADTEAGVQVGDQSYLLLGAEPSLYDAGGSPGTDIPGFPFFNRGRLFSAGADGASVSAFDQFGTLVWTYALPVQVSAFASSERLAVAGTVGGVVQGIGMDGRTEFSFAPGGSRLEAILGLDVSPSGDLVAMVCGADRQRLVVLGKGGSDYRVVSHRYLDSDYREPVRVAFLDGGRWVLYRSDSGIGVWSSDGSLDTVLSVNADDFSVWYDEESSRAYVAARLPDSLSLVAFEPPNRILGRLALPPDTEYIRMDGGTLYFGTQTRLSRIDFVEE